MNRPTCHGGQTQFVRRRLTGLSPLPGQGGRVLVAGVVLEIGMLTRSQVANRLGKSIATVRRMEGTELHPRRSPEGVNLFDPVEVAEVARRGRARLSGPRRRPSEWRNWRGEEVDAERQDAEEERCTEQNGAYATPEAYVLRSERVVEASGARSEPAQPDVLPSSSSRQAAVALEHRLLCAEVLDLMSSLSPTQLRRFVTDADLAALSVLLDGQ